MNDTGRTQLVPFGIDEWPSDLPEGPLTPEALAALGFPHAVVRIDADEMLRMNRQRFALPAMLPRDMSIDGQYAALFDHLAGLCSTWDRLSLSFLSGYSAFLRSEIDRNRPDIEARLRPYDDLFLPEHFLLSAPLPLPRAHLIGARGKGLGCTDFAFRLSGRWLAMLASPSRTMPAQTRRLRRELEDSGAEVREFTALQIRSEAEFFRTLFRGKELAFWESETLPSGLALQPICL